MGGADASIQMPGPFRRLPLEMCTRNIKCGMGEMEPYVTNMTFHSRGIIRKQSNVHEAGRMPGQQTPGAGIYLVNRVLISYHDLTRGCSLIRGFPVLSSVLNLGV